MPILPMVDAHVHLWDPTHFRIPWLDSSALLKQPYVLDAYRAHTDGLPIEGMVYVQVDVAPAYALLEAHFVAGLAQHEPRIGAIVAWAPLEDGDCARSYLDALVSISPLIKGVRRIVQSEPDVNFSLRPNFVRGVQLLPAYGLTCDICINHTQLAATIALVRQCPEVAFMLDHSGKPAIAAGQLEPWRAQMSELAALPNVLCKLSGLVTEANHQNWTVEQLAPYVQHVLAVFGEDRVVFGGDWPVVLLAAEYRRWVDALDSLTASLPEAARHKLWAENARRFYRLG
ncbi:MAG: amidohydrolase family protein [Chloroflexi bacterium SZAS-1]|nr:amidohydrolase family protein [Chloroflexi bacterium SZAS-1]